LEILILLLFLFDYLSNIDVQKYEVSEISPNKYDKTLSNFDIFNIWWWKGRAIRGVRSDTATQRHKQNDGVTQ